MGLSLTAATLSEFPIWFYSDVMLRKWRPRGMLIFSFFACALQAFGYGIGPYPWLIILFQLLHGPAFSAMWAAGVSYAADISTESTRATAQAMFGSIAMGLRAVLGTLLGGLLYDSAGPQTTFRTGGLIALIGLLLFFLSTRESQTRVAD